MYARAYKSATPQSVVQTLKWIKDNYAFSVHSITVDLGSEFRGKVLLDYLSENKIEIFYTLDPRIKSSLAERAIRYC